METEKDLHTLHTKTLGVFENITKYLGYGDNSFFEVSFSNGGVMSIPQEEVVAFISQKAVENERAGIEKYFLSFSDKEDHVEMAISKAVEKLKEHFEEKLEEIKPSLS